MNRIEAVVRAATRPVALTGAGISAPSGIPTFQGSWKGRPIRDFLGRDFCMRQPIEFFELFQEMVSWCEKEPNPAHKKLAEWDIPIITQNIDGLHHRAGSRQVLELHGSLRFVHCPHCGRTLPADAFAAGLRPLYAENKRDEILRALTCACGARYDTDVVLYGDSVRCLDQATALASSCDLMLVIGSSLTTYPAAALPDIARRAGAKVITINDDCVARLTGQE